MQQNCVELLKLLFLYEEEGKTQSEKMHFLVAYLSMEKLSEEKIQSQKDFRRR